MAARSGLSWHVPWEMHVRTDGRMGKEWVKPSGIGKDEVRSSSVSQSIRGFLLHGPAIAGILALAYRRCRPADDLLLLSFFLASAW